MYVVCVDTSVLVTLYLRLRTGDELKGFDELKALIAAKKVKLAVPQVTILELQKFVNNAERELLSVVARIESQVGNEGKHVKDDLAQALAEPLETWQKKKAGEMRAIAKGIFDWLETGEQIKFTQEIAHETRCRIIAGKFPDPRLKQKRDSEEPEEKKSKKEQPEDKRDQDCFIIDSLISHFGSDLAEKNLLFATTDNGFGTFGADGTGPLDDTFQQSLPPARIFNDLSKLVAFVNDEKTITLPTADEVEAEKKREVEEEIKQEIKFQHEATAQVLKPVVARFEMPIEFGPPGSGGIAFGGAEPRYPSYLGRGGITFGGAGPISIADHERRRRNMANYNPPPGFFNTQNAPPPDPPSLPNEGLQTFNGNVGDDEPKKDPEPPPKTETDESSEPPKQ